jgi:hypothetical protein
MPLRPEYGCYQIVYQSGAWAVPSRTVLDRLDHAASAECDGCRLTGTLIRFGDSIVGLLEGEKDVVLGHVEAIVDDLDGQGIQVLREAPIPSRRFANWTVRLAVTRWGADAWAQVGRLFAWQVSEGLYRKF